LPDAGSFDASARRVERLLTLKWRCNVRNWAVVFSLVVISSLSTSAARAANPAWADGYPKTGTTNGTILVKGTINLGEGLSTTGLVTVMVWSAGGGPAKSFGYSITAGQTGVGITWGEFPVGSLARGQQYNVIVTIDATDGTSTFHFTTDPAKATAK
jgi:hypothetical protein